MREFFRAWRRKIGVMTLVMACVVVSVWVHSFYCPIQMTRISSSESGETYVTSNSGCVIWMRLNYGGSSGRSRFWAKLPDGSNFESDAGTLMFWHLRYWWVAIPLTLLSTYLLLSKPRVAKPTESTKPTDEGNNQLRVGTYKDGGSIAVTYECEDLFCRRTLFFKIDWGESVAWKHGEYVRQFNYAELWEHHGFQWTSNITGVTYDDAFDCKLRVSWATARQILNDLLPQVVGLSDMDRAIFDEMDFVAKSEGTGRWVLAHN